MFEFHPDMGVNYSQTPLDLDQRQWCLSFILTWGSTRVKPHWFWTKRNVWVSSWHGGQLQSNPIGSGPNAMMFEFHPDMGVNYSQTPLVLDQTQWCLSFILTWGSTKVKPHWLWTKRNVWVSSWHGGQLQSNPIGSGPNAMIEFHPDMGVNYSQTPLVLDQTQWCLSFILTWGSTTVKPHWIWTKHNDVWVLSWHGGQLQSNPIGSGPNATIELHLHMGVNYSQTPLVLDQTQWCLSFILTWGSTTVKPHWFWTKRNDVWVSSWHGGQLQSNPIGSGPNTMMFESYPDMGVNYSQTPLVLDQTQWCLSFILTWGSTTVKPHWIWTKHNDVWVLSWHGGQLKSNPISSGPNAMMFEFHPDMGVNYSQTPLDLDQTQWCLSLILTWGSTTVKPHWFWTKRNDWVSSWHGGQLQSNPIGSGPNTMMFESYPDMGVNYSQTPLVLDQTQCLSFILIWGSTTVKPHWFWTKRNDVWVLSWHGGQLQSNPIGSGPNAMFEFHPDMGVNYSQTPLVLDQTQCLSFILTWGSTTVKPYWFWTKRNDVWVSSWHGGQLQSNPIGSGPNAMMFEFHPDMGVNYSQTLLVLDQTQWCLSFILTWGCILFFGWVCSDLNDVCFSQLKVVKAGGVVSIQIHQVLMTALLCDAAVTHEDHLITVH